MDNHYVIFSVLMDGNKERGGTLIVLRIFKLRFVFCQPRSIGGTWEADLIFKVDAQANDTMSHKWTHSPILGLVRLLTIRMLLIISCAGQGYKDYSRHNHKLCSI